MYVIADLEWFQSAQDERYPTQIAAVRVDNEWKVTASFASLIHPAEGGQAAWEHVAFAGASEQEFLQAPSAQTVLEGMQKWLREDDVLCWWQKEPSQVFEQFVHSILGTQVVQKKRVLKPYFTLKAGRTAATNPYDLSLRRGLRVPETEHCSKNDVFVVWQLMRSLNVSASMLEKSVIYMRENLKEYLFLCDEKTGLLHIQDSSCLEQVEDIKGMRTIKSCLDKQYRPCPVCCMERWNRVLMEYNEKRISETRYEYFFEKGSDVFHRRDCEEILLSASAIQGTIHYNSCIEKGRIPCQVCSPMANEESPIPEEENTIQDEEILMPKEESPRPKAVRTAVKKVLMNKLEKQALMRYEQALKERNAARTEKMSRAKRRDMIVLTATDCAFWAAAGYQTFHLRKCRKLNGLENLRGFTTFQQAVYAGYQPCRECRPTAKDDVRLSMPLNTIQRQDEKVEDVLALCSRYGMEYDYQEPTLDLYTPAAQWRINTGHVPIVPEHRPGMCAEFHKQHRMFWSLTDAVKYIHRHDSKEGVLFENMLAASRKKRTA